MSTVSVPGRRSTNEITATSRAHSHTGEKTRVQRGAVIGLRSSFNRSVTANAAAEAPSRARTRRSFGSRVNGSRWSLGRRYISPRRTRLVDSRRHAAVPRALEADPRLAADPDEQRRCARGQRDDDDHARTREVEELDPGEPEHGGEQEPEDVLGDRQREPPADQHARDRAEQEPEE